MRDAARRLTDLMWEQVEASPDRVALSFGDEHLTFARLARRAAGLAQRLRREGVRPDDCVGLYAEPSLDLVVGCWAILLAGGAYLPLSPDYPEERLRYMIEDSRSRILCCQGDLEASLRALVPEGRRVVTVDDADAGDAAGVDLAPELRAHHLAYVIYTSGSTGRPKGVMIEHRNIVNQLRWLKDTFRLDHNKVVLQKTPMSFDAAQWELLAAAFGSRVVVGRRGVYRDPSALIDTIVAHEVTVLQCVPTLLRALLALDGIRSCRTLTQLFCGGEVLSRDLALQCVRTLPWCELTNLYGPTECTINASSHTVDRHAVSEGPPTVTIGAPVRGTRFHILDADRRPVGPGEIGELYISGAQLARGYLHRPDLTAERFVASPFVRRGPHARLYRTGDLGSLNADGTVRFAGRTDNQIKLRGYRVELDEIGVAIEAHDWVKRAAVRLRRDPRTGFQNLVAFMELDPNEAALMDQGLHTSHHQSKADKLQVLVQLSDPGCREADELTGKARVELPGRQETPEQRRLAFGRKTYRNFEGGGIRKADILRLLTTRERDVVPRDVATLQLAELGRILRTFGQFVSRHRLLPKYAYASPGALYATQMYLELSGLFGLEPGYYYFHPIRHALYLIQRRPPAASPSLRVHLVGKKRAIEPVYQHNIQEVLEIEAGHLVGLFDEVLPDFGLCIREADYLPAAMERLECADEDFYLGAFDILPHRRAGEDSLEHYVQAHPGRIADLPAGQYVFTGDDLERISDEIILKKHVIAINQQTYERASLGITVVNPREGWTSYLALGRKLQHLQMNDSFLGFMSSGYSSKTGHDLPAARRVASILGAAGRRAGACYFFLGGRVSEEQWRSEGMREDAVHTQGPAEMIRDDLAKVLPHYMVPNRVVVLGRLPLTANGKIDVQALDRAEVEFQDRPFIAPRTQTERRISELWKSALKLDHVSVQDTFFESGGDSLIGVSLVHDLNRAFHVSLPLQILFECSTIEQLAQRLDAASPTSSSRLVLLHDERAGRPAYCWPGLGGYTMNLRALAERVDRPVYGVQAHGINPGEAALPTIAEMAAADIRSIVERQPEGPYTLWGYSFGARVAFEAAHQLEQAGRQVDQLLLIAPGSPVIEIRPERGQSREPSFSNEAFVTILLSVFTGSIAHPALDECLRVVEDVDGFVAFVSGLRGLDPGLVRRIVEVVRQTFEFEYTFAELTERRIQAPITIFKARGDDYSFIENSSGYSAAPPTVVELEAGHYDLLRERGVEELIAAISSRASTAEPAQAAPTTGPIW